MLLMHGMLCLTSMICSKMNGCNKYMEAEIDGPWHTEDKFFALIL